MKKGKTKILERVKKNKNLYQQLEQKTKGVQKRLYFKRWVEAILWVIVIGSFYVLCSEVTSTSMFFKSKLIAFPIFAIATYLLNKYSRLINK